MDKLRKEKFPRCITPREGKFTEHILRVFGDRLQEAFCSSVYVHQLGKSGQSREVQTGHKEKLKSLQK
jgi:hypothetical protein